MSRWSYYDDARDAYDEGYRDRYHRNPYERDSLSYEEEQRYRAFHEGQGDRRREEERREERAREEREQEAAARRRAYEEAAYVEEMEREEQDYRDAEDGSCLSAVADYYAGQEGAEVSDLLKFLGVILWIVGAWLFVLVWSCSGWSLRPS